MSTSKGCLAAALVLLASTTSSAFTSSQTTGQRVTQRQQQHRVFSSSLSSSHSSNHARPTDEAIRQDIDAMREEAMKRLQTLNGKMDNIRRKQHEEGPSTQSTFLDASTFEYVDLPETGVVYTDTAAVVDHAKDTRTNLISVRNIPELSSTTKSKEAAKTTLPPSHISTESSLLHDTRWKVVIRVGSTNQVALLEGVEKPLLLHLEIDFLPEALVNHHQQQEDGTEYLEDPLLQGGSEDAKVMHIRESWVGASSLTEGRQRDVKIQSTGGWKILHGQGPKGIDILRFYIDVEEEICHDPENSHLRCPAKRVYCTMGIFSMAHHNEAESYKDYLRGKLNQLVTKYEDLTLEDERDNRIISLDQVKRAKQMMDLRAQIKSANRDITNARIRDPEKGLLRLSRRGDVGVTKEGQVCYRDDGEKSEIENGASSAEYLVLGKFEAASVSKPIVETPRKRDTELRP